MLVHVSALPQRRYYLRTKHPMPDTAPAAFFSELFSDYLASAIALQAGVTALNAVQRRHLTSTEAITNPNLMVQASVDPASSDALLTITIKLELTVQIGVETGQTTTEQAQAWLKAFRSLLSDSPEAYTAWDEWTLSLSDADKTGWYVQAIYPQVTESDLNADTNVLTLTAPYQVISFWNT